MISKSTLTKRWKEPVAPPATMYDSRIDSVYDTKTDGNFYVTEPDYRKSPENPELVSPVSSSNQSEHGYYSREGS